MGETIKLEITDLGSGGDGIGAGPDGPIYVAYAVPGDFVVAQLLDGRARLVEIVRASPQRKDAECRHFTRCGGCAVQNLSESNYTSWKRALVTTALSNRGLEADVSEVFHVGHHARRRAVLSAALLDPNVAPGNAGSVDSGDTGRRCVIGFNGPGSHDIINMAECPVLADKITEILPRLRAFVEPVLAHVADIRIDILQASNGISIDLIGLPAKIARAQVAHLSASAPKLGAIQVTMDRDPIFSSLAPVIRCGRAEVVPPAGVFLQASKVAEEIMVSLILDALTKRTKRVADLFCGLGAFSFPLAERSRVNAFDSDVRAIDALKTAMRATKGIKPMEARVRDLFLEPLSRKELDEFDMVVFDPPRAGAKKQALNLAQSKVPVIVAVSCNPATFARDARTLVDGGYVLQNVTPIDQFVYAAHVELVAVFRR